MFKIEVFPYVYSRFANIMKELMLMPDELKQTNGCRLIMREYAHSFQVILISLAMELFR